MEAASANILARKRILNEVKAKVQEELLESNLACEKTDTLYEKNSREMVARENDMLVEPVININKKLENPAHFKIQQQNLPYSAKGFSSPKGNFEVRNQQQAFSDRKDEKDTS